MDISWPLQEFCGRDIPRVVLVEVGSVVMLATGKTTTTRMLAVLSYTTVTGGHMAAAREFKSAHVPTPQIIRPQSSLSPETNSSQAS
jgi:hypothetical protein